MSRKPPKGKSLAELNHELIKDWHLKKISFSVTKYKL